MSKPKLHVLKVGGRLIEQEAHLAEVLAHFLQKDGHKLLIHGGGKRASELEKKLEIPTNMVDGRRITDADSLEIVVMVYAGLINKRLVSQLQSMHCNAVGLSGADGNAILAHKRPVKAIDYGFVGDIDQVNTHFVDVLLKANTLPVFCAVTHNGKGQLLNTNADTIAAALASAMAEDYEVHAYFCLEKNGVLSDPEEDEAVIKMLDVNAYERFKADGTISAGMIPKLDNGFGALEKGVEAVVICGPESFLSDGGTKLI